jgi:hypothetical protein
MRSPGAGATCSEVPSQRLEQTHHGDCDLTLTVKDGALKHVTASPSGYERPIVKVTVTSFPMSLDPVRKQSFGHCHRDFYRRHSHRYRLLALSTRGMYRTSARRSSDNTQQPRILTTMMKNDVFLASGGWLQLVDDPCLAERSGVVQSLLEYREQMPLLIT